MYGIRFGLRPPPSLTAISLILLASLCSSSPLLALNKSLTTGFVSCLPQEPYKGAIRLSDCQHAISRMLYEKQGFRYILTHDPSLGQLPGYLSCPYMKTAGNCAMVLDFSTDLKSKEIMSINLELWAEELIGTCVGRPGVDGGVYSFDYFRAWIAAARWSMGLELDKWMNGTQLPIKGQSRPVSRLHIGTS